MIAYAQFGGPRGPMLTHECEELRKHNAPAYAPNRSLHDQGRPADLMVRLGGDFDRCLRRVYVEPDNTHYILFQGDHVRIDMVQA